VRSQSYNSMGLRLFPNALCTLVGHPMYEGVKQDPEYIKQKDLGLLDNKEKHKSVIKQLRSKALKNIRQEYIARSALRLLTNNEESAPDPKLPTIRKDIIDLMNTSQWTDQHAIKLVKILLHFVQNKEPNPQKVHPSHNSDLVPLGDTDRRLGPITIALNSLFVLFQRNTQKVIAPAKLKSPNLEAANQKLLDQQAETSSRCRLCKQKLIL
jgi:hypothetical protein